MAWGRKKVNLKWGKEEKMKLIIDEPKAVPLDESYCKRNSENSQSFIDDKFYENKQPGIFDDNFQGIEWPVKKQHEYVYGIDRDSIFDPIYGMHILNGGAIFYHDDDD